MALPHIYRNVPRALTLIRELRGKSQAAIAREAGMGKSQVSKYENGKELPKLDTLAQILQVLNVNLFDFWYTVHLIDAGEAKIDLKESTQLALPPPLLLNGAGLISGETDAAFKRLLDDVMKVYHQMNAEMLKAIEGKN
jgi:transcriptional regulator with XRE-family HTH domain